MNEYRVSFPYMISPAALLLTGFLFTLELFLLYMLLALLLAAWIRQKFYKVTIDENSIVIKKGILITLQQEIPLSKINNIDLKENVVQKFFNTGTIVLKTGNDGNVEISSMDGYADLVERIRSKITQK